MIVGARRAGSSISETTASWAFCAQQCLDFTDNGAKKCIKKTPVDSDSPVCENSLLMREAEEETTGLWWQHHIMGMLVTSRDWG